MYINMQMHMNMWIHDLDIRGEKCGYTGGAKNVDERGGKKMWIYGGQKKCEYTWGKKNVDVWTHVFTISIYRFID